MPRILVIDDEELIRASVGAALSRAAHTVSTAATGEDGVEQFRREPFDLVITDVRMPGISGPEVIRILREFRPTIPVIVMGGGGSMALSGPVAYAREVGADRALLKPFGALQVVQLVAQLLGAATGGIADLAV